MPKIITDLEEKILKEAKKQSFERGYENMTIRSVAKGCGIAIGTIYNYYPSKDYLAASFILKDWMLIEENLKSSCMKEESPIEAFRAVYIGLHEFHRYYSPIFRDKSAIKNASLKFGDKHRFLRGRLSSMIERVCMKKAISPSAFLPDFVAEALITWSSEDRDFYDIEAVLKPLFYK